MPPFSWASYGDKLALEAPVGAERDEAGGFLPAEAAHDLLHRRLQVVISQNPEYEYALKILEGMFVSSRNACWVAR